MLWNIGLILSGLAILIVGAQLLVKGASRLALALGIAPLIVGLTIVAFGTSAPELASASNLPLRRKQISCWAMPWAAASTTCSSSWACVRPLRRWRSRHSSYGWMFQSWSARA